MEASHLIVSGEHSLEACTHAFARAPREAALFCDIDGTISPVASRPADAVVPARFHELLAALRDRVGLLAFVTGRGSEDGHRLVPLDDATYVGAHGLELMSDGHTVQTEPLAERYVADVQAIAAIAARDLDQQRLGIVLEDKRTVLAIHYRLAPDTSATRHEILRKVIEPARARGLAISTGHCAFEVRPPLPFTKGTAIRRLLDAGSHHAALTLGDDLTDITGFRAIHEWAERDGRRSAYALAAVTAETPEAVSVEADIVVAATPGVAEVLTRLQRTLDLR
ncbi:MAG TPA: trehalose-phosphatase [Thermoleophilia bacterium]|nr:trehalose-phosphatase [Thermoleophilia bacterium]